MTARRQQDRAQHILLLGASGVSGLAFIQEHPSIPDTKPTKPYLTLYIRGAGRSKLTPVLASATSNDTPANKIRIVEGGLTDANAIRTALSADGDFPKVTVVISVLGAYMSLYYFLTRTKPTPISDAMNSTIIPAMREMDIKRIFVLSTPSAFPVPGESKQKSWGWYFSSLIPIVAVPQANAEMKGIAHAIMDNSSSSLERKQGLEATVFRVPMLSEGSGELEVRAFVIGGEGNTENRTLSRRSMARWVLKELEERKWVGGAPVLCNLVAS